MDIMFIRRIRTGPHLYKTIILTKPIIQFKTGITVSHRVCKIHHRIKKNKLMRNLICC